MRYSTITIDPERHGAAKVTKYKVGKEQSVIRSIVDAEFGYPRQGAATLECPPVVTLSRDYGAGGNVVAELLSQRLGVEVYDREILDGIADASKVDRELMEQLDEKVRAQRATAWVRSIFTNNTAFPESYRYHLVNVVLGICNTGGIIVGRGAHIVLAARPVFRVRIVGSETTCAERIAEREDIPVSEALEKVAAVNQERGEFLWQMFHRRQNDATLFDLTVNTDHFPSFDAVADLIVEAMAKSGYLSQANSGA